LNVFRSTISKDRLLGAFPTLVRLLQADSNVVHSYSAIVVERLLTLRIARQPLLVPADVSQHISQLLQSLFAALSKPDSTENEYLMRCIMRVINFVGPDIASVAGACLDWCVFPEISFRAVMPPFVTANIVRLSGISSFLPVGFKIQCHIF
jgi:exportin-2 (importin alpha re-exporter)